jgi:hypothetical protein
VREGSQLDRVDKVLLVLPLLPAFDLLSTLFSLGRGGQEVGILARPILEEYGAFGLFPLAVSASVIFLSLIWVMIRVRRILVVQGRFKWTRQVVMIPVFWMFLLQGAYVSTVVMNFMVPLAPALTQMLTLRIALVCAYFVGVSMLVRPYMRQIMN